MHEKVLNGGKQTSFNLHSCVQADTSSTTTLNHSTKLLRPAHHLRVPCVACPCVIALRPASCVLCRASCVVVLCLISICWYESPLSASICDQLCSLYFLSSHLSSHPPSYSFLYSHDVPNEDLHIRKQSMTPRVNSLKLLQDIISSL